MGHLLLPLFLAAIISTAAALLLSAYLRFDVIVPEKYLDLLVMQLPSFIILTLMFALMLSFMTASGVMPDPVNCWQLQELLSAQHSAGMRIHCF